MPQKQHTNSFYGSLEVWQNIWERRRALPWVGGGPGECNPFIWIHSLKLSSFPLGSSQPTWYRNKPNRCLLIKQDERKRSFALWPRVNWWLRWRNAIVVEETCNRAFQKRSGVNVCACALTLFLCGDISSLIRAHLLRVFSLLQTHTHMCKIGFIYNGLTPCFSPKTQTSHHQECDARWKKGWNGMKHRTGEEKDRGGALGAPRLANELLKDNPHMSEKRMRGRQKRREWEEWNLLEWRRQLREGGRKLIPSATWRRGEKVVVGSTLWRALRADHVTIKRWRGGNWGMVGTVGRGQKAAKRGDDSFKMYGGTPAVV